MVKQLLTYLLDSLNIGSFGSAALFVVMIVGTCLLLALPDGDSGWDNKTSSSRNR